MKARSSLLPALLLALLLAPVARAQSEGALTVANGDFRDPEGLSEIEPDWYSGIPAGWTAAVPPENSDGFFAVRSSGASELFANLHVLSRIKPKFEPFQQEVGVVAETSDITLTFDTTGFKGEAFSMGVAIANARGKGPEAILAKADFEEDGPCRVVGANVPVGTSIAIRLWAVMGFPGIGNVEVAASP